MKYIRKFNEDFDDDTSLDITPDGADKETYEDTIGDIRKMIEDSLKTSDIKTFEDFISAYIKDPEDTKIEGLINDSDVFDFYLKYRNDIDSILSDINFYDEVPSELSTFGLYDYIIKGTQRSILEFVKLIK